MADPAQKTSSNGTRLTLTQLLGALVLLIVLSAPLWVPGSRALMSSPSAQAACGGESHATESARTEYTKFDPASEPQLRAPVNPDQVSTADRSAYLDGKVRYWWITQENCSGFGWRDVIDWSIHTYPNTTFEPAEERSGELITCRYRDRRATDGDQRKLDLRRAQERAERELTACIERACKPVADEIAKAARLHDLHSSENTARALVEAEEAMKECRAMDGKSK